MSDKLEVIGDVTLNLEYWDCECNDNYIHPNHTDKCQVCGAEKEDQPNSRQNEVLENKFGGLN